MCRSPAEAPIKGRIPKSYEAKGTVPKEGSSALCVGAICAGWQLAMGLAAHFSENAGTRRLYLRRRNHKHGLWLSRFRHCRRRRSVPAETEKCSRPSERCHVEKAAGPGRALPCRGTDVYAAVLVLAGGMYDAISAVAGRVHCGPCSRVGVYTGSHLKCAQPS